MKRSDEMMQLDFEIFSSITMISVWDGKDERSERISRRIDRKINVSLGIFLISPTDTDVYPDLNRLLPHSTNQNISSILSNHTRMSLVTKFLSHRF